METKSYRRPMCKIVAVQPGRSLLANSINSWGNGNTITSWIDDDEEENDDENQ